VILWCQTASFGTETELLPALAVASVKHCQLSTGPALNLRRRFYPLSSLLASLLCRQHLRTIELQFELSDQEKDILAHQGWVIGCC
jgi:hypothetical protein